MDSSSAKPTRTIRWNQLEEWEHFLLVRDDVTVTWKGANGVLYPGKVLKYRNGNLRLRFDKDGRENEPCYIEQIVQVETPDEIIKLEKPGQAL